MSCLFIYLYFVYNTIHMTDYSFTSLSMILFSLIASIYLFNGAFFRYRTQLTLYISTFIVASSLWLSIIDQAIIISFTHLFTSIMALPLLTLLLILTISLLVEIIVVTWIKSIASYMIIITSSYILATILKDIVQYNNFILLITTFVIFNVLIFILYKTKKYQLFIITSTVTGAIVLSSLFATFYYFPTSVHLILCIVLLLSGFFIQRHTYKEVKEKESK